MSNKAKNLRRTILEFGTIVFLSEHCLACKLKVTERRLVLIKFNSDVNIDAKEYAYFGVPLCLDCFNQQQTRDELIKKVEAALAEVPYKILTGD